MHEINRPSISLTGNDNAALHRPDVSLKCHKTTSWDHANFFTERSPLNSTSTPEHRALPVHKARLYALDAEIHRRGPRRPLVEYATLEWVDWFNNRRLLQPIGSIPLAEAEAAYYASLEEPPNGPSDSNE